MTFYIDDKNEKIIKNYKKENNSFIIEYLDGTKDYIKESNTTLDDIHLKMIKQAIKRDQTLYSEISFKNKLNYFFKYFSIFAGGFSLSNRNLILLFVAIFYNVLMQIECEKSTPQISELKKYRMYLRLLNISEEKDLSLEYIDNNNIQKPLNINELDYISYKEFKKLNKAYKLILKKINNKS